MCSYSAQAVDLLQKAKQRLCQYTIDWKDGAEVMDYVKPMRSTHLTRILKEQYLRHPLAGL